MRRKHNFLAVILVLSILLAEWTVPVTAHGAGKTVADRGETAVAEAATGSAVTPAVTGSAVTPAATGSAVSSGPATEQTSDPAETSAPSGTSGPEETLAPGQTLSPALTPTPTAVSSLIPAQTSSPVMTPTMAPTSTPVPTTLPSIRFISRIEVTETMMEVPYSSSFGKDQVTINVYYSDGTVEKTRPDSVTGVDTSRLGPQTLTVTYQGVTAVYDITVVPRQVTGVKMKSGTSTTMTVVWQSLPEAEHYDIYTSKIENGSYVKLDSTKNTEYTFKNLQPGQIIYIKIQAVSGDAVGEFSAATPIAPRPGKVTGLKATYIVRKKVTLTWNPSSGATGYAIYYRLTTDKEYTYAGKVEVDASADTQELTYTVTGLTAGKDYYFVVYAYAVDLSNLGDASEAVLYGTAPKLPEITLIKGGDKRVKLYWSKSRGAQYYQIYVSTKKNSGYSLSATAQIDEYRVRGIDGLKQKKTYYVKVTAVRKMSGFVLSTDSEAKSTTTKKAKATSTKPKLYKTKKKFKKSAACKKYKAFRKKVTYNKSFVCPGLKNTNVAGFGCTSMVPQGVAFAKKYMLITAFDYQKEQESVMYVMDKNTKKYVTTLVMPHMGHLGGIAFDGTNLWIAYGKNLQCLKYSEIKKAAASGKAFWEITKFTTQCAIPETASYVGFYKNRVWVGSYNEYSKKYMYGFKISNKNGTPTLKKTNQVLMPNRTQGVAFTSGGKLIISRSCQTRKELLGFMSQLETYKPTWNLNKSTIKLKKCRKVTKLPPMNEGIAINGSYTYVLYESSYFWDCKYKMDRVTAFRTGKVS